MASDEKPFQFPPPENLRETWGKGKPLEWIADALANKDEDSQVAWAIKAEFLFRQTEAQIRQAEAAERAAKAAEQAAEASITSAKQMVRNTWCVFWSMIFIALTAVATVVLAWHQH
jgi:hypothetical protein